MRGFLRRLLERGVKGVGESGEQEKVPRVHELSVWPQGKDHPRASGVSTKSETLKSGRDHRDPLVLESPL